MFDRIRIWWYRLRLKWAIGPMSKAMREQARVIGEVLVPEIREAIEATDAFARAYEKVNFQIRNFDYWNKQF